MLSSLWAKYQPSLIGDVRWHYIFYEVKSIVKAIIGPKNWPSQWSRPIFFFKKFLKSIIRSTIWPNKCPTQLSSQLYDLKKYQVIFKSIMWPKFFQVNCQVNYLVLKKNVSIIVIFWLILVGDGKNWPTMVKYGQ